MKTSIFLSTLCPVNLRIDGLVYDEQDNSIAKKESCDRIVELPSDGFLFPLFNDRAPDINGVLYYTKNAKKPNTSVVEELLGCEFSMTCQNEKETFKDILTSVVGDELDYDLGEVEEYLFEDDDDVQNVWHNWDQEE